MCLLHVFFVIVVPGLRVSKVAVPGLMAERLSKQLLESSYLHVDKTDILLKVEASQRATAAKLSHPLLASAEGIKVQASTYQEGTVVRGLPRLIVLDRKLARRALSPELWLCEKQNKLFCESGKNTGACVVLATKLPNKYGISVKATSVH